MTKRSSILQKKLQELETQISHVVSLPNYSINYNFRRLFYRQDMEQRIEFLKNLLSAEITSSPEKPHHLDHIAQRLSLVESAFRTWDQATPDCEETRNAVVEGVAVVDEKAESTEMEEINATVDDHKGELKKDEEGGGFFGGLATGTVIGMVVMAFLMVSFFGGFSFTNYMKRATIHFAPT